MFRKINIIIISLITVLASLDYAYAEDSSDISAECAVVMCADTGEVIFEKNSRQKHSMASTTKIMTALIALENCSLTDTVTVCQKAVDTEGTVSGLKAGDIISVDELLYCMMLSSGNDAANEVALFTAGDYEDFALLMNEKAGQIGMNDSHFVTPSGLDSGEHYSTAYDMALLTAEAMKYGRFQDYVSSYEHKCVYNSGNSCLYLTNHNRLLNELDGCIGVKTGFTKKSGRCLISAVRRNGCTVITVTLNAPDDWQDHKILAEYAFSRLRIIGADCNFSDISVAVTGGDVSHIGVYSDKASLFTFSDNTHSERLVYTDKFVYAPVNYGDTVGYVEYYADGKLLYTAELKSLTDCGCFKSEKRKSIFNKIADIFRKSAEVNYVRKNKTPEIPCR